MYILYRYRILLYNIQYGNDHCTFFNYNDTGGLLQKRHTQHVSNNILVIFLCRYMYCFVKEQKSKFNYFFLEGVQLLCRNTKYYNLQFICKVVKFSYILLNKAEIIKYILC